MAELIVMTQKNYDDLKKELDYLVTVSYTHLTLPTTSRV